MNDLTKLDVIVGVKAEQSLRDAVRTHVEESDDTDLELTPVGRKDWVAGQRLGANLPCASLETLCRDVHRKLMKLDSRQRIRFESLKLYVVQAPVPVFKDPVSAAPKEAETAPVPEEKPAPVQGPSTCPVCGRSVHSYNLHYNTDGKVVGCFMCGGVAGGF